MKKYLPHLLASTWMILSFCSIIHAQSDNEIQSTASKLVWRTWQPAATSQSPQNDESGSNTTSRSTSESESEFVSIPVNKSISDLTNVPLSDPSNVLSNGSTTQTVKKSPYTQVQYTQIRPPYYSHADETEAVNNIVTTNGNSNGNAVTAQNGVTAPQSVHGPPETYSTQQYIGNVVSQGWQPYHCGSSRTIPDRYPSPEPFPGANHTYHLPNTDDYCETAHCGMGVGLNNCVDPCCDPCAVTSCCDPCYDPCASIPHPQRGPYLFDAQTIGPCGTYSPGTLLGGGSMFLTGWVNAGATFSPNDNNYPLRYTDQGNEFVMNQLYLSFGKSVNKNGPYIDLGARVDLLYGTDYFYTSALGLETDTYRVDAAGNRHPAEYPTNAHLKWNKNHGDRNNGSASVYGFSMPQLYAELFLPVHRGFTAKFGHFYSIMGYESVMAPQNFFYSRTLTSTYGEPTTHTGVLFSQKLTSGFSLLGGVTRGWDVWDSDSNGVSGLFGTQWDTRLGSSLSFSLHTGKTASDGGTTRTNYSLVWVQPLNPTLKYVLQHDLGVESDASFQINGTETFRSRGTWISIVQYLECQWTPSLASGLRFEWFRDEGHSRILQSPTTFVDSTGVMKIQGDNYFNISLGAQWKPREFLTIRPEVRWDWADVKTISTIAGASQASGVYDNYSKKNQCTASLDFIVMF